MSRVAQTPGDRASRYAAGAETVLYAYATQDMSDLAWGLHMLAADVAEAMNHAIEGDSVNVLEDLAARCCKANAIVCAIAHESDNDLLLAGEALMEAAKIMLNDEIERRPLDKAVQP
jgi:hypothetical protein